LLNQILLTELQSLLEAWKTGSCCKQQSDGYSEVLSDKNDKALVFLNRLLPELVKANCQQSV